jgi:hypothetical protein
LIAKADELGISREQLGDLEKAAYKAIKEYVHEPEKPENALSAVMAYDRLLVRSSKGEENLEARYKLTLTEKPWEKCKCEICQKQGVDVLIFRGTNRNKRRGYHNTWTFRNTFMKEK